jgi:hypothetical protein
LETEDNAAQKQTQTRVECPGDAPNWFQTVFIEISREEVGGLYERMLEAFVELEKSREFKQGGSGLPTVGRPSQVSDWIKDGRGRSLPVRPIHNLEKFEKEWWVWWTALQPEWRGAWRGRPQTEGAVREGAEWGKLGNPGQNGILSVVAALYWWACAEKARDIKASKGWEEAVVDTTFVLRAMTRP